MFHCFSSLIVIKNTCTGSLKVVLFTENIVTVSFIGEETGVPGENHQPAASH
jgi:hypothetical protein